MVGYLVPPQATSPALAATTARLRQITRRMVDNGNFTSIGLLAKRFDRAACTLFRAVQRRQQQIKRSVHAGDLSEKQQRAYRRLAEEIAAAAHTVRWSPTDTLRRQLTLEPTHLIGHEDITLAVMLRLNMEEDYLGYPTGFYEGLNRTVAREALAVQATLPATLKLAYYPVACAMSYDSAFRAGRVFAQAGIARVSMGFGAYMADDNYRNILYVRGRRISLPFMMPNRYVRTAVVALGFWDGYRAHAGGVPDAFHFLGLGAPIMLPIVALCGYGTPDISFDATSPIRDAGEGFIYSDEPAYIKLRTRKIALALASGAQMRWDCSCGFCKQFVGEYPFNYYQARKWFTQRKRTEVRASDLQLRGGLYESLPLFSEPNGGNLRKAVNFARMGHNHWVLERIIGRLRDNDGTRDRLRDHLHDVTHAYATHTGSETFAQAMSWITNFVVKAR